MPLGAALGYVSLVCFCSLSIRFVGIREPPELHINVRRHVDEVTGSWGQASKGIRRRLSPHRVDWFD